MREAPRNDSARYYDVFIGVNYAIVAAVFGYALYVLSVHSDEQSSLSHHWTIAISVQTLPALALLILHHNYESKHPYARSTGPSSYHAISVYGFILPTFVLVQLVFAILVETEHLALVSAVASYASFFLVLSILILWLAMFDKLWLADYQLNETMHKVH